MDRKSVYRVLDVRSYSWGLRWLTACVLSSCTQVAEQLTWHRAFTDMRGSACPTPGNSQCPLCPGLIITVISTGCLSWGHTLSRHCQQSEGWTIKWQSNLKPVKQQGKPFTDFAHISIISVNHPQGQAQMSRKGTWMKYSHQIQWKRHEKPTKGAEWHFLTNLWS